MTDDGLKLWQYYDAIIMNAIRDNSLDALPDKTSDLILESQQATPSSIRLYIFGRLQRMFVSNCDRSYEI